jgi:hypothetical protein
LKIVSKEALATFDDIALPTISIYRGGDLYTSLVRIQDSLPSAFDEDHLEVLLKK